LSAAANAAYSEEPEERPHQEGSDLRDLPPEPEAVSTPEDRFDARTSEPQAKPMHAAPEQQPEPAPEVEGEDHPLDRSFSDREKADTGENLRFDFSNEEGPIENEPDESAAGNHDNEWQVGDTPHEFDSAPDRPVEKRNGAEQPHRLTPAPSQPASGTPPPRFIYSKFGDRDAIQKTAEYETGDLPDDVADMARGRTHSSGFFLAMYFLVAVSFLAVSAIISGEPAASARLISQTPQLGSYFARPILPAMLVSLRDVQTEHRVLKGGQPALVVTGSAQNVGRNPLHLVQIDGALLGPEGRPLSREIVFSGNELSAKMLGEMTPREIEFSQGLTPQKNFVMQPKASAPFVMIFMNPPDAARNVRIGVTKAIAPEGPPAASMSDAR
jgi:hypothetical protein